MILLLAVLLSACCLPVQSVGSTSEAPAFKTPSKPCGSNLAKGMFTYPLTFEGERIEVKIFLPGGPPGRDLVVALHGGRGGERSILNKTRLLSLAKRERAIVVAPTASHWTEEYGTRWRTGKFASTIDTSGYRDDVAFLDALTRAVKRDTCSKDVLALGFSNGGQMVQRWVCEGQLPTAALSAAGSLLVDPKLCRSARPIRAYVGTADRVYDESPMPGKDQPSSVASMDLWAKINGCSTAKPTRSTDGPVTCQTWRRCEQSTVLCVVDGFHHGWPGPADSENPGGDATLDSWLWFNEDAK